MTRERKREPVKSDWTSIETSPDPTLPLLTEFRKALAAGGATEFQPTGLNRGDYLRLIQSEIDFWKRHQNKDGAIIDPYMKREHQYSTPAFAHAAAALVTWDNRKDLLEPAAKALDWSVQSLRNRTAADGHEDFFPPMIAHSMALLKPHVAAERCARWEADIRGLSPTTTYRMAPGTMNWNIVSACGEALFEMMGLRRNNSYVETSLAAQGRHFASPWGLYTEGPMAYDLFPRMYLDDLLASCYDGPYHEKLEEILRRGAITSLFMESPGGELPAGGRSAHHQWNESEQCAVFEVHAARALRAGDSELAAIFKRAAHLAFRSMQRWVRPTGEMQIVKNWVDPDKRHGYEHYSGNTQYNLLPMSMLALAYQYGESTAAVEEKSAPADLGGFVFEIPELRKIFANASGTYVEIETTADAHYDATGLIRIQFCNVSPQLGPSDSVLAKPGYQASGENHPKGNTGIGVSWKDQVGDWRQLGELSSTEIRKITLTPRSASPGRVEFDVTYEGELFGVSRIVEQYVLTSGNVELTTELVGHNGPLRYVWPVLAYDGRRKSDIRMQGDTVSVSQDAGKTAQLFTAREAQQVQVQNTLYPNHNGWSRLAVAEYPAGGTITLLITPRTH